MTKDDKSVAAIIFGIVLILGFKIFNLLLAYLVPSLNASLHQLLLFLSGALAAFFAFFIAYRALPRFLEYQRQKQTSKD
jgi:hypothetical protein